MNWNDLVKWGALCQQKTVAVVKHVTPIVKAKAETVHQYLTERSSLRLRISYKGESGRDWTINKPETYIGRSDKTCEVLVPVEAVSRIHAVIRPVTGIPIWRWFRAFLGWPAPRYILSDYNSANGVFKGSRLVKKVGLAHRRLVYLGDPASPSCARIRVIDPPPRWCYITRFISLSLLVLTSWTVVVSVQEWQKIPDLRQFNRGPILVVAADDQTLLRRNWSDAPIELGSLKEFGLLPRVLVAAEDRRFYQHWGVDLLGIGRAVWINLTGGQIRQGGSSISQQLARTILRDYTGTDNSLARKRREALAALKLEWTYDKEEILRLYLNNVYMGNGIYGFATAAQFYFGKRPNQLNLSEAAILVGLLPAPNVYNPLTDMDTAIKQRQRVFEQLTRGGAFTTTEVQAAARTRVVLNPSLKLIPTTLAPYFYATVIHELDQILGPDLAAQGNFFVETSLNPRLQSLAETTLSTSVAELGSQYGFKQGSLVTLDSRTGEILALVGGVDYRASQFNRALQAQRQPGSTFKIFTYAAALDVGIPTSQSYSCASLVWQSQFRGCRSTTNDLSLAQGLMLSENVVALRVAQQVGLNRVVEMASRLGINSPIAAYPAMVLGTVEVNMLELTRAFATLANHGQRTQPHAVRRIFDTANPKRCRDPQQPRTCPQLYPGNEDPQASQSVVSAALADTMTELLRTVVTNGTGRAALLGRGEAGKTGTTTDNKDLWFVGYVPNPTWVSAVWLGNDDSTPTRGSSAQAALIWRRYMQPALTDEK